MTLALLVLAIAAVDVYRDLSQQRERRVELEEKIRLSEDRIRDLEARIERMKNDAETLERLAREELGLVRPEDIVVVFPEERRPTPPNPLLDESGEPASTDPPDL
ncbi:MAG: septum formation initiator family protein [Thermoanaerobaculia bacterium]|nr:septum formation initiator family protein [Thermoanaerobaculia bacterium]